MTYKIEWIEGKHVECELYPQEFEGIDAFKTTLWSLNDRTTGIGYRKVFVEFSYGGKTYRGRLELREKVPLPRAFQEAGFPYPT